MVRAVLRPIGKILRLLVPRYFINSYHELKKVTWPGRKETWRLTAAVFAFAIIFGTLIYFVDLALDKLFRVTVLR
jgi:preprotein translocase SecE subunit